MLNIIDLFSGGGGLSEGFRDGSKFNIICHIEKDSDACETLKLREAYYFLKENSRLDLYKKYVSKEITREELFKDIPKSRLDTVLNIEINRDSLSDIFKFVDMKTLAVDGIVGGPPCQAYSTIGRAANEKKKESDERIYLYKYYLSFLRKYRPKFFVFENVKGLLSFKDIDGKLLLPKILKDFKEEGYSVENEVVNSSKFGVSQNRERLFIFGIRNDLTRTRYFFDELMDYQEKPMTLNELFSDLPAIEAGSQANTYRPVRISALKKQYYRDVGEKLPLTYHEARSHIERDLKIYKLVQEGKQKGKNIKYNELPQNLQTHSNVKSFLDRFKALDGKGLSHTVVAHISRDGHYYIHPNIAETRSISVREAARIQGFPDNYYFEKSRTAALKQIGNAVPPILSKKIANSIVNIFSNNTN